MSALPVLGAGGWGTALAVNAARNVTLAEVPFCPSGMSRSLSVERRSRADVPLTLALLPITVALGFVGLAIAGSLMALVAFDAIYRAVQRAIMRPARETLFTVVPRTDRYKSKAFIDTFVYRGGDQIGARSSCVAAWDDR